MFKIALTDHGRYGHRAPYRCRMLHDITRSVRWSLRSRSSQATPYSLTLLGLAENIARAASQSFLQSFRFNLKYSNRPKIMATIDDRSTELFAVIVLFLALTWITFPMRLWVRVVVLKQVGLDDILAGVTMAVFTVFASWVIVATEYGAGRHNKDLNPLDIIQALKVRTRSQRC